MTEFDIFLIICCGAMAVIAFYILMSHGTKNTGNLMTNGTNFVQMEIITGIKYVSN